MVLHGHIIDGQIVLEGESPLPEGASVTVTVDESARDNRSDAENPTAYERIKPIIGIAKDLPPDAARNVDHYLYGHPKK